MLTPLHAPAKRKVTGCNHAACSTSAAVYNSMARADKTNGHVGAAQARVDGRKQAKRKKKRSWSHTSSPQAAFKLRSPTWCGTCLRVTANPSLRPRPPRKLVLQKKFHCWTAPWASKAVYNNRRSLEAWDNILEALQDMAAAIPHQLVCWAWAEARPRS
jgi:hypothetical protein